MRIEYLADYPDCIPTLGKWFYKEWEPLYKGKTIEDVTESIRERQNRDKVPMALVAIEDDTVIGTICLKIYDMETHKHLSPWLAGLYVAKAYRGRGIAIKLIEAMVKKAKIIGIRKLYLYTFVLEKLCLNLGWSVLERPEYKGINVVIMERALDV